MRVTCLTKSLACGGAERQLCTLALLFKRHGLGVSILTYHPDDYYLPLIEQAGIEYRCIQHRSMFRRLFALRAALRGGSQDVVLAFQSRSCVYAEIAALPSRPWGLVVSERSAIPQRYRKPVARLRPLHRLADYVTTNSHSNRFLLERSTPVLAGRVATIYNTLDLGHFAPSATQPAGTGRQLRLVVAARHCREKNGPGLVEAVAILRSKAPHLDVTVDWYGSDPFAGQACSKPTPVQATAQRIRARGLEGRFRLQPACKDVVSVYCQADAVVLASFYEGLPNSVCEAMACGRPVLMSNVCDAGNLVVDGHNGFVFDPYSPEDMARAIARFGELSTTERVVLGARGRALAEEMFDPVRVVERYLELLAAAAGRRRIPVHHWVPAVPATAEAFLR
jgi:glycosyltransferase involved in cell wall biosynthesis